MWNKLRENIALIFQHTLGYQRNQQIEIRQSIFNIDRLYGLVVRVPGYRSRGSGFDSRRYQIF
jgi:hypothetical protein